MTEDLRTVNCVMTVPEAARHLGVGKRVVYDLLDTGALAFTRVRGAILIDCDSVEAVRMRGVAL